MTPKRFIAGAVCPRCAKQDKIRMFRNDDDEQIRECVSCGFTDAIAEEGEAEELPTRVNQPKAGEAALPHEDPVDVVKIFE